MPKPMKLPQSKDWPEGEIDIGEYALAHDSHERILPTQLHMTEPECLHLGNGVACEVVQTRVACA
jgi:hypothetical protein